MSERRTIRPDELAKVHAEIARRFPTILAALHQSELDESGAELSNRVPSSHKEIVMNSAPSNPTNTIEDSLRNGHDAAYRASNLLDIIWIDLTGDELSASDAGEPITTGVVYGADRLATKLSIIADRLESIRCRISSPKVVGISQAQNNLASGYATKGYAG